MRVHFGACAVSLAVAAVASGCGTVAHEAAIARHAPSPFSGLTVRVLQFGGPEVLPGPNAAAETLSRAKEMGRDAEVVLLAGSRTFHAFANHNGVARFALGGYTGPVVVWDETCLPGPKVHAAVPTHKILVVEGACSPA